MGGIYVRCVLNFLGNWQIIFQSSNSTFDSLQQCSRALGLILVGLSQFNLEDRWTPIMCSGLLININFLSLMTLGGQSWHITPIFIDHDTVIQLEKQYDPSKDRTAFGTQSCLIPKFMALMRTFCKIHLALSG